MKRTWGRSLAIWLPLVAAMELLSLLMVLEPTRPWAYYLLILPVWVFCDLSRTSGDSVAWAVLWFLQWPVGLLPLLGWLRTRRRYWLYLQTGVVLVYVAIALHFLLTFEGF